MVKSMTGYGASVNDNDKYEIKVEIKSVNSRYLDINIKGPRNILFLENKIHKLISSKINRGTIYVYINISHIGKYDIDYSIDQSLLSFYLNSISEISTTTGFSQDITVLDLLTYDSNLLRVMPEELDKDTEFIELFLQAVNNALKGLLEMKSVEGYNMKTRIKENLASMYDSLIKIEEYTESMVEENITNLKERISIVLAEEKVELSEDKLINEVVFLSDKLTIDEEITRLKSHIKLMTDEIESDKVSGKKLDFIAQEMIREANTIGSKSSKVEITNLTISIKEDIENIREQVQNIE